MILNGADREKIAQLFNEGYTYYEIASITSYDSTYMSAIYKSLAEEGLVDAEKRKAAKARRLKEKHEQAKPEKAKVKKIDLCPIEKKLKCYYGSSCGTCDYMLIEGKRRPCEGGKKCTCFRPIGKDEKSGAREYTDMVQHLNYGAKRSLDRCY